jgi:trk system potassium uptake protein TrkH
MRKILSGIGLVLHVPGFMALLSVAVSFYFGEVVGTEAFLLTALASFAAGQILYRLDSKPGKKQHVYSIWGIMAVASLGWLAAIVLAAIPYFYTAQRLSEELVQQHQIYNFQHGLNALFEALSGYTSSGLTVTISESSLPASLQWWRSFQQWIGAVGIIVFISSFFPGLSSVSDFYGEDDKEAAVLPEVAIDWTRVWWIYMLLTLLSVGLYLMQGLPLWEAINHGMTGISTGGFSITDDSLKSYSVSLRITSIVIMLIGSLNFECYYLLMTKGNWKGFLKYPQHLLFFGILLVLVSLLYYETNVYTSMQTSWTDLIFQASSALGTCGFQSVDLQSWHRSALLLLTLAMLIGGPSTSTTGGIKLFRLYYLMKGAFYNALQWVSHTKEQEADGILRTAKEKIKPQGLYQNINTFFIIWIGSFVLVVYILAHNVPDKYTFMEVAFECASAIGTTGLSVGITSHDLNAVAKIDLMFAMYIGRLELIPLTILLSASAYSMKKR